MWKHYFQTKEKILTPNPIFENWESHFPKVNEKLAKNPMNKVFPYFHLCAHIHIFHI